MGNAISSINLADVPAKTQRTARTVAGTYSERKGMHVKRARLIGELLNTYSQRGVVALVTAVNGYRPTGFSETAVGSYDLIRKAIARNDVAANLGTADALEDVVNALYRLAGPTPKGVDTKPAERVSALADEIAKANGSAEAVEIATAHVARFNGAQVTEALTPVKPIERQPQPPAPQDPAPEGDDDDGPAAPAEPSIREAFTLASVGIHALMAEVARRVQAPAFTPDADLTAYAETIAEAFAHAGESIEGEEEETEAPAPKVTPGSGTKATQRVVSPRARKPRRATVNA